MSGFRRCGRKPLECEIQLRHQSLGEISAETRDISESGVFVKSRHLTLAVGDTVNAQMIIGENPSARAQLKVVRTTTEGIAFTYY